ncbi:rhodanese-like domain-containing protein [uncultured Sulfitobacter sp.]|uniref:rhodanese-like domain-containing protein n=1 Tax=uncultured Sulfitobacter sp. TaxID=191468 RepID=UPI0026114C5F|nr:rhodanese-like domain-containing protein [uncultured Sulfitobacter sp.]
MATPSSPKLTRRVVIGTAIASVGGVALARWYNIGAREEDGMNVSAAYAAAIEGRITLIDIRRPDEWAATGIAQGAIPLDMRDPEFAQKLLALVPDPNDRIALICARGVRSRYLAGQLTEAGFTNIIDVPEGMLGSGAGPGWLAAGLPVTKL